MMRKHTFRMVGAVAPLLLVTMAAGAQEQAGGSAPRAPRFFDVATPLSITINADFKQLRKDRVEDEGPYRPASLVVSDSARGVTERIPLRVRTRGHWRLKNCDDPPLMLNFASDSVKGTTFAKEDKLKLVLPCRRGESWDQLVFKEYNIYRIQNVITPYSHRARLVRVVLADSANRDIKDVRWGFLLEELDDVGKRVGAPEDTTGIVDRFEVSSYHSVLTNVFQYMIGASDFSIPMRHNIEILRSDSMVVPVAYDFDWTGAVNAPYARPDPKLPIRDVRQRIYRGFCLDDLSVYPKVWAHFESKKADVMALFSDEIAGLMSPKAMREQQGYVEDFYKTLADPKKAKKELMDSCRS